MVSVRSRKNQYQGINAHLHSQWQASGGWNQFHVNHIADITRLMRADLYPMGYTARTEQSVQIRRIAGPDSTARADVLIIDDDALRFYPPIHAPTGNTHELVAPLPQALGLSTEDLEYHQAVGIYRLELLPQEQSEPVAWLELLSPSNKPGGQDWRNYRRKRQELLQAGMVFVELDYLHESSPTLDIVSDYRTRLKRPPEAGSHPYRIAVIDPHPEFAQGQARVRQFDVDAPLPVVDIPLDSQHHLTFDFNTAYCKTFDEMLYGNEVDYGLLPLQFDRYAEADQARILSRMLTILKGFQAGHDLEASAAKPIETLPLEAALAQFSVFGG